MKKLFVGLGLAVVMAVLAFPIALTWNPLQYREESTSPGGTYTVMVKHSDGAWPFGPVKVKVYAKENWFTQETYETEIWDDGGPGSIEISWLNDMTAEILLHGDEQKDEAITITFSDGEIQITARREEPAPVSPPPEPTREPVGIMVDVGDGEHTFWVEVVDTGEPWGDCNKLLVNIYRDEAKGELFQTFESWWADPYGLYCFPVEDMDFDGDTDFAVCNQDYRAFHWCSHYIWDEAQERFVEDPYGLNDLLNPSFDAEWQVVRSNSGWMGGATTAYYQYRKGSLACIRSLFYSYSEDEHAMRLKVEDEIDGVLTSVYKDSVPFSELPEGKLWTEEFERWYDPDYHGE